MITRGLIRSKQAAQSLTSSSCQAMMVVCSRGAAHCRPNCLYTLCWASVNFGGLSVPLRRHFLYVHTQQMSVHMPYAHTPLGWVSTNTDMVAPNGLCSGLSKGVSDEGTNSTRAGERTEKGGKGSGAHLQAQDRMQRMHQPASKRCACCSVILFLLSAHNFLVQLRPQHCLNVNLSAHHSSGTSEQRAQGHCKL